VAQDKSPEAADAGERARISEAERHERLTQLVLRRSKLSDDEVTLLGEVFPDIFTGHRDQVWSLLQRRGVESHDAEDLLQDVFLALHNKIVNEGFADSIPGMLHVLTVGKVFNHQRGVNRDPLSIGLPSSGSEKPRSQPDAERDLHFQEVAWHLFSQLSPAHQEVLDKVVVKGYSHTETAAMLGIAEGTVKSRLIAAKHALSALAERLLPSSQRGPV
jgi:RNA polymerase sigma-70 factor (ECF subfamily)